MNHKLRVSKIEHQRIMEGSTTFLIREKGIGIQKGDELILQQWGTVKDIYKWIGEEIDCYHVGDCYSMDNDHVAFSLVEMVEAEEIEEEDE